MELPRLTADDIDTDKLQRLLTECETRSAAAEGTRRALEEARESHGRAATACQNREVRAAPDFYRLSAARARALLDRDQTGESEAWRLKVDAATIRNLAKSREALDRAEIAHTRASAAASPWRSLAAKLDALPVGYARVERPLVGSDTPAPPPSALPATPTAGYAQAPRPASPTASVVAAAARRLVK